VVAGRIGAAMAAELGTMRVTEQLDAMNASLDPFQFLLCLAFLPPLL
jgi:phospholipid/cholesterol/gamma-HCH transport system permease protein